MTQLHEFLYCSLLAPGQSTEVVGRIVTLARTRNAQEEITGLLVFDGMRFCQHVEGPRRNVLRLLDRLESDPRHIGMQVVYEGGLAQRRFRHFELGLAEVEDSEDIVLIGQLDGAEALTRFLALRPRWDISG